MSAIFQRQDRAYCMDAGYSALRIGQLYVVIETLMQHNGEQAIRVTGHNNDWYNASRFARLPDPCARRWPTGK